MSPVFLCLISEKAAACHVSGMYISKKSMHSDKIEKIFAASHAQDILSRCPGFREKSAAGTDIKSGTIRIKRQAATMTATEGSKKLPVYIVLDSSAKETPAQFEELEQCFFNIYNGILSNSRIASRIEISLITYGGEAYNPIPLGPVTEVTMPTLRQDYRPKAVLGAALLKVSNMVKMELGSGYYSPVVMILTNGAVTDKPFYKRAINELSGCDFTLLAFFTTAEVAGTEKINLERLSENIFQASDFSEAICGEYFEGLLNK